MEQKAMRGNTQYYTNDRPKAVNKEPRICALWGCITRLSIYNHDEFCSIHQPLIALPARISPLK